MSGDPQREDDPTPDAAEVEAVYAFLRRSHGDLVRNLERTLPVEAAIEATIGPEPEPPASSRPALFTRLWRGSFRPGPTLVTATELWAGTGLPTLARIDADLGSLISATKRIGSYGPVRGQHRAEALLALHELRAGLRERRLSKEQAEFFMAVAEQHLERLLRRPFAWSVTTFSGTLVATTAWAYSPSGWAVLAACGLALTYLFRAMARRASCRARDTFTRLKVDVDLLFDDSDDHSGTAVRR